MPSARFPELEPQPSHVHGRATHTHSVWGNVLYNASLFSLVVLVSIVLLASGYDVAQQVIVVGRGSIRFTDTAITGAGYVLVGIISTLVAFSRLYSVRQVLAGIPKAYIPTGRDELNKVHTVFLPLLLVLTNATELVSASRKRVHPMRDDRARCSTERAGPAWRG